MSVQVAIVGEDDVFISAHDTLAEAESWAGGYVSGASEYGGVADAVILEPGWEVDVKELDQLHGTNEFGRIYAAIGKLASGEAV